METLGNQTTASEIMRYREIETYRTKLRSIANQLEKWADESKRNGWSTNQVEPMLELSKEIFVLLGR